MLKSTVKEKITDILRHDWDAVFPDVVDGYPFFKSLEESDFRQFSFRYILVYDKDALVGIAPCFLMDYPLDTSMSGLPRRLAAFIRKRLPSFFAIRAVVCGTPMGQGKIGMKGDYRKVIGAICACMDNVARKERAQVVAFKDFNREYAAVFDALLENGFSRFDSLPSAEMDIDFKNFDDYLMRLSHATRYDLRRKFRKTENLKFEMEVKNSLTGELLSQVYGLYRQQVNQHDNTGFEVVPEKFFKNISENMPDKTRFLLWRLDKKLVAFVFGLASADFFSGYYLGLDHSVAHQYHLYFLRFRDMMNWFITTGIRKCDMGVTGYEPKKRLDFSFTPLYIYVRYRNPVIRPLFNMFCNMLRFEHFDPLLKDIRKQYR